MATPCNARWLVVVLSLLAAGPLEAAEWYAGPQGKVAGKGTRETPWGSRIGPGRAASARPRRYALAAGGNLSSSQSQIGHAGYVVQLKGQEAKPIRVRAEPAARVTIDGALSVQAPSDWLWISDLEFVIAENSTMPRRIAEGGSSPGSYGRPWGGLNVFSGRGCKYIHLVIHDTAQGISFWSGATDNEIYGCIIYDNGWEAPDRGHGHAIYTQNEKGLKTIADCIMTGGYGFSLHAYGSPRAFVNHYLAVGNIVYRSGPFLIGGGRPSRDIRVFDNFLYRADMQIGYSAASNEDCQIRDNLIVNGGLSIKNYRHVVKEGNQVISSDVPRPAGPARVVVRPSRYDPRRANVAIFNWPKGPAVELRPDKFLQPGDLYRLMDPRNFFGRPVLQGVYEGKPIRVPVDGEFAALVMLKTTPDREGAGLLRLFEVRVRDAGNCRVGRVKRVPPKCMLDLGWWDSFHSAHPTPSLATVKAAPAV